MYRERDRCHSLIRGTVASTKDKGRLQKGKQEQPQAVMLKFDVNMHIPTRLTKRQHALRRRFPRGRAQCMRVWFPTVIAALLLLYAVARTHYGSFKQTAVATVIQLSTIQKAPLGADAADSDQSTPPFDILTVLTLIKPTKERDDLNLLTNQLRSFSLFIQPCGIAEYLVVTPDMQVVSKHVSQQLASYSAGLRRILRVKHESLCSQARFPDDMPGWHRQQLFKLACASIVRTPFYLVMVR